MRMKELLEKISSAFAKHGDIDVKPIFTFADKEGVIQSFSDFEIAIGVREHEEKEMFIQFYNIETTWEKLK